MAYSDTGVEDTTYTAADTGVEPGPAADAMDKEDFQNLVRKLVTDARTFIEDEVSPDRATAARFYEGKTLGNEEDGRSKVVVTVVKDTINSILPGIARAFFGPERVAEFRPADPDGMQIADEVTDTCHFAFTQDNPGFLIGLSMLKDAFVKKMGVVKVWWEDRTTSEGWETSGLTPEALAALQQEEGVTLSNVEPEEVDGDEAMVDEQGQPIQTYRADIVRTDRDGRLMIEAVPPEEFIFNRSAKSLEDALIVGQIREVRLSDLVEMGYDKQEVIDLLEEGLAGRSSRLALNDERQQRTTYDANPRHGEEQTEDWTLQPILYGEVYPYADVDGDGIAELRKVCIVGEDFMVLRNKPAEHRPFALCLCDPEPHALMGSSISDRTMDLQMIASSVMRGTLDSLNLTIHQRTEVVEGMVNMPDLLNTEIGGIIRVTQPGMLREIKHTFVGEDTLPFLDYLDQLKEQRTGISKASAGLNPDALQSSTRAAVAATISAAQQQVEMLARVVAETGFKQLFNLIYREIKAHQDFPRFLKLRSGYKQVDPRLWDAKLDLYVETPIALGSVEAKLDALNAIIAKQENLMQLMGPSGPLTGLSKYSYALSKFVELSGWKDGQRFFNPISPEQEKAINDAQAQAKAQNPPQDPNMVLAQIEQQRVELNAQLEQMKAAHNARMAEMKLELEQATAASDHAFQMAKLAQDAALARERMALDFQAKLEVAALQGKTSVDEATVQAHVETTRAMIDADLQRDDMALGHAVDLHDTNLKHAVAMTQQTDSTPETA